MDNKALRQMTRSIYDLQKLRIQTGNRITGNFRAKLGQEPGGKMEDAGANKLIKKLVVEYRRLTDAIAAGGKRFKFPSEGPINTRVEYDLIDNYIGLLSQEEKFFRSLEKTLKSFPIYTDFLVNVKGCGPAMSAVIISELDPSKAHRISGFWKYAGLDVCENGKGRSRKAEHLVDQTYIDKEGNEATKKGITFNPFLKTKLTGVLGSSFLRAGENKYSEIYRNYKHRLENHPDHMEKTKLHRHNMANRYAVKMFLQDLWLKWRELEGFEVTLPYSEAKLGLKHAVNE